MIVLKQKDPTMPTPSDMKFNFRMAVEIERYWRERGKKVVATVCPADMPDCRGYEIESLYQIQSNIVNGVPRDA